tara:strand:- start:1434 stop:1556 length:123 start_codon:yes stop_codon:yes gene_type:complete
MLQKDKLKKSGISGMFEISLKKEFIDIKEKYLLKMNFYHD